MIANLIEPNDACDLTLRVERDVDRASKPIQRVAACMKCRATWTGAGALAAVRKHAAATGHPCWTITGRWEMVLPKDFLK